MQAVTAWVAVTLDQQELRRAIAAWEGVKAILARPDWRGLLHEAYEPYPNSGNIEPYNGNHVITWPERVDKPATDLTYFEIGLPFGKGLTISSHHGPLDANDFVLVYVDPKLRRGVLRYLIAQHKDGSLPSGDECDELLLLTPDITEDNLARNASAYVVFAWNSKCQITDSICVIPLAEPDQPFARTFFELTPTERQWLLGSLG